MHDVPKGPIEDGVRPSVQHPKVLSKVHMVLRVVFGSQEDAPVLCKQDPIWYFVRVKMRKSMGVHQEH